MNAIQKAACNAIGFVDEHKTEIILTGAAIGAVAMYRSGYYAGCVNGAVKVLEGLEKVNPENYRALIDEAIAKGATVRF